LRLQNPTVGEANEPVVGSALGPEAGFYVRRGQSAEIRLPSAMSRGEHDVDIELGLAGVTSTRIADSVLFT
jgi:hypothetical protein